MLLVGVTGGIGSGKSTVARLLGARGAVVLDADEFARRAVDPGTPGHAAVVEAFGSEALEPGGEIDRAWLADRVFEDRDARRRLETIVHPEVARLFAESIEPYRSTDSVVVCVVPLLVESHLESGYDVVVAVSVGEATRTARVVADRGMTEERVRARAAAQLPDAEREQAADVVIRNEGTLQELERRVDELWRDLETRARAPRTG